MEFKPANKLEEALVKAMHEPAARPEFYRVLMQSNLLVIPVEEPVIENGSVAAGQKLMLASYRNEDLFFTAFFTSETRVLEAAQEGAKYISMAAKDFFELTLGGYLIMNAASPYHKEFYPDEVQNMLKGNYGNGEYVIQEDMPILVGQPANYPDLLVEELKKIYKSKPEVKAAYLVQYVQQNQSTPPALMIGLELRDESSFKDISRQTGEAIGDKKFHPHHEYVDVVSLAQKGMSFLKKDNKPFYKKSSLLGF